MKLTDQQIIEISDNVKNKLYSMLGSPDETDSTGQLVLTIQNEIIDIVRISIAETLKCLRDY